MQEQITEISPLDEVVKSSGLATAKQNEIGNALGSFFAKASEWNATIQSIVITSPDEVGKMKMAREGRLTLKNLRLEAKAIVTSKRDTVKARMADDVLEDKLWLKAGQMMEATFNNLETKLEEKEKFAERWEANRKAELKAKRDEELTIYSEFVPFGLNLGELSQEDYDKLFNGAKLQSEARIEAEKKAEAERKAKELELEKEREAQRLENQRLKAEAEKREKEIEAERKANEEKQAKERALAKAEADKLQAEANAKLKAEQESKAKLEAEIEANRKAEAEKKQQEQAELEAELSKGDKEKMVDLIKKLEEIKTQYSFKSKKYSTIYASSNELLTKTVTYIQSKIV